MTSPSRIFVPLTDLIRFLSRRHPEWGSGYQQNLKIKEQIRKDLLSDADQQTTHTAVVRLGIINA